MLGQSAGLGDIKPRGLQVVHALAEIQRALGPSTNEALPFETAQVLDIAVTTEFRSELGQSKSPPVHCNGIAPGFSQQAGRRRIGSRYRVASIEGGYCCHLSNAPLVFSRDRVVVEDFSTSYARLCHFYDRDIQQLLDEAIEVDGAVVVIGDGLNMPNYCHWLCDWLVRLAFLENVPDRSNVFVVTVPPLAEFQRESLLRCGFDERRVISLAPFQALKARQLLVPDNLRDIKHPAQRASHWALGYLQRTLAPSAGPSMPDDGPLRIYVSRSDAARRRVANEEALFSALERKGFVRVVLSGLGVGEQAGLFARATHIVSPHGAGLANLAFAHRAKQVVELFAPDYGTPAFHILAQGNGISYASYVVGSKVARSRPQLDDMVVDVEDFEARCGHLLQE